MDNTNRVNALHHKWGELKSQHRIEEMVPVQLAIIAQDIAIEQAKVLANDWNYLSGLYHQIRRYADAEFAARVALNVYQHEEQQRDEVLACYKFMLARILAAQCRFAEAVEVADSGVEHYAVFHNPP